MFLRSLRHLAPGLAMAGEDTVIVQDVHSSPDAMENVLYFDKKRASLFGANVTQPTPVAQPEVGDCVAVRVAALGAIAFGNSRSYFFPVGVTTFSRLLPAPSVALSEPATALATDSAEHLHVAHSYGATAAGVLKILTRGKTSSPYDGSAL